MLALSSLPALAAAHGRITKVTTSSGVVYPGWDPASTSPSTTLTPPHPLAAWSASNLGNVYIPPDQFDTSNIACHYNSVPGALHINATAGETLRLQWNEWPVSHVGPVMTYLAECTGSCADADKETLQWVKIDELGWLNSTGWDELMLGGTWASSVLIANGFEWMVKIPDMLAGGNYVLRHEIIALHVADEVDGAQAYPQCVNLRVGRGGSMVLDGGVLGTQLYGIRDEGILVDVHRKMDGYQIPGPQLWSGATPLKQPNQL
ncbi:glycoside hydrolase [Decorospora gaudefroyi]|uniref:Glycoside hydrolase n=1 Tax=Decorospora gaudefroyi TaxID=184978 RepID=A0A6A5KGJ8_9PLEO|nr:glycoside hydrolase [Decorospora gaudefroyi]